MLTMMAKEMTRKEFIGVVVSFFGLLMLSRLKLGGASKPFARRNQNSYGNASYGGQRKA